MTNDEMLRLCEEAVRLAEAATEGPWLCDERVGVTAVYPGERENCLMRADPSLFVVYREGEWDEEGQRRLATDKQVNDCQFIAASRTLVPSLAAALREIVERVCKTCGGAGGWEEDTGGVEPSGKFISVWVHCPECHKEPPCPAG